MPLRFRRNEPNSAPLDRASETQSENHPATHGRRASTVNFQHSARTGPRQIGVCPWNRRDEADFLEAVWMVGFWGGWRLFGGPSRLDSDMPPSSQPAPLPRRTQPLLFNLPYPITLLKLREISGAPRLRVELLLMSAALPVGLQPLLSTIATSPDGVCKRKSQKREKQQNKRLRFRGGYF